jgi:hypothetical protein
MAACRSGYCVPVIARRRLLPLLALAALLAAATLPAAASSYPLPRWHKRVITFRDKSGYTLQVLAAIGWINDSPVRVTLKPAKRGKPADIEFYRANHKAKWDGIARPTRSRSGRYYVRIGINAYYFDKPNYYPVDWLKAEVITHEIGHALGLPHRKGCSIMVLTHPSDKTCRPVVGDPVNIRCGLFRADALDLIRRYGGRISTFDAYRCPPIGAPVPPVFPS